MPRAGTDRLLAGARREALFTLVVTLGAMTYSTIYCARHGFGRPPDSIRLVWGFPDWVFFGIVIPWMVCLVITVSFALWGMGDEPLEEGDAVQGHDEGLWEEEHA